MAAAAGAAVEVVTVMDKAKKVIGLGLSRTGTTSLGEALNQLGIRTIHFPHDAETQKELEAGTGNLSVLKRYQGVVDIPVLPVYKQIDALYPNSKFILTTRAMRNWLKSVRSSVEATMQHSSAYDAQYRSFFRFINRRVYGSSSFDEALFMDAYERHVRDVIAHFKHRPNDLLLMDITNGDGWEKLCPFLGLPQPRTPFPLKNDRKTHVDWLTRLGDVKRELEKLIPAGAEVVLIDHSALDMVDLQALSIRSIRLTDWGMPANDREAIDSLERRCHEGATHLVLAWPAFWWFDHYAEFMNHVRTRFKCLMEDERLVIFEISLGKCR